MAVDSGYGSGKSRSAANSSARRRVAAGQLSKGKKKMGQLGSYKTPGLNAAGSKLSGNLLEAFTGFNKKDGVDAGDFAGLAISIPTGGLGGIARAVGRAVIPKAARVAGAASRVAKSSKVAAKAGSSKAMYLADEAAKLQKKSSDLRTTFYTELYGGRKIALTPTEMGLKDAAFFGGQASSTLRKAKEASDLGARAARRSNARQAAYEIQLKLAALQRAKKAEKKVIKPVKGELQW